MKKMLRLWFRYLPLAALVLALSATAQQGRVTARQGEIASAARIYGYSLDAGNWSYDQTRCAPMPDVTLFHYRRAFPDGAESRFTAVVPREGGRVRIVQVLYHNATPYLPAPENPRNYALFNELVPQAVASRDAKGNGRWLELSACYADLTGALTTPQSRGRKGIGIAEAPSATIRFEANGKTSQVTIATGENAHDYKLWTISFNRRGRVTAVETEDHPVYAAAAPPVRRVITGRAKHRRAVQAQARTESQQPVTAEGNRPAQVAAEPAPVPEQRAETNSAQPQGPSTPPSEAAPPSVEPGWKFIPEPPAPRVKIVPPPPTPALTATPDM